MYGWNHKSKKNTQNPSFSSTLLDQIYHSMDDKSKLPEQKVAKKQSVGNGGSRPKRVEGEGIATLRGAFLVEKWMDMKRNPKTSTGRTRPPSSLPEFHRKSALDNDPMFSGSSSSDSSFGWLSEHDGLCHTRSRKPSCFSKPKPKTVKKHQFDCCSNDDQSTSGALIKSKARALKIYANLKKVKQPISPGGRLATFLNSLFTNGHVKKPKDSNSSGYGNKKKIERTTHGSTCSSASSFTRSCLSKNSPRSREKLNNGIRRTVRFYPVSVIIDEDSRPCGQKFIRDEEDFVKYNEDDDDDDYNDDDDTFSDSSSDLFELDHLSILNEELPVYETTHFGTNRAIANGLIC